MRFKNKFEKFWWQQILALKKLEKRKGKKVTKKEIIKYLLFDVLCFIEKQEPKDLVRWFNIAEELKRTKKRQDKVKKILKGTPIGVDNIPQMIQKLGEHTADTYFGTRKKLNDEFVEYINMRDSDIPEIQGFWNYIEGIQVKYDIPDLTPKDDIRGYTRHSPDENKHEDYESKWLESQTIEKCDSFKKEINEIIERYDLSEVFYDWFWWLILYDQIPPWKPLYNWDLIVDERDIKKIPLTTGEKNYLRNALTDNMDDDKRRPKKEAEKKSKKIKKMLRISGKEKRKPFLTIKTALKTLNKIGKEDDPIFGIRTYKKTFKDIVAENFDEGGNDETKSGRLRKQNERIRKRIAKIMKLKKLKK